MEGTIAEIRLFAPNFAPRNWAFCNGQILSISQNTALFSLLGTTFGGNGQTTFALPNLQSRAAVGTGTGIGLSGYTLGQSSGAEAATITANNVPPHNHPVTGTIKMPTSTTPANAVTPAGNNFANDGSPKYNTSGSGTTMAPATLNLAVSPGGNGLASNIMPYLAINYIICLFGIFPSRN
jgi:microcystin-dependent protein